MTSAYCRPAIANALDFISGIHGNTQIIVDLSNATLAGRNADFRVDFTEFLKFLGGDKVIHPTVVASIPPDGHQNPLLAFFLLYLRRTGYHVEAMCGERQADGSFAENEFRVDGRVRHHLYAAVNNPLIHSVVLFSGDGGYTNAIKKLCCAGKDAFVVAWERSANPALVAAATDFAAVEKLRPIISRCY